MFEALIPLVPLRDVGGLDTQNEGRFSWLFTHGHALTLKLPSRVSRPGEWVVQDELRI